MVILMVGSTMPTWLHYVFALAGGLLGGLLWKAGALAALRARRWLARRRYHHLVETVEEPADGAFVTSEELDALDRDMAANMLAPPEGAIDFGQIEPPHIAPVIRLPVHSTRTCSDCKHWDVDAAIRHVNEDPILSVMRAEIGAFWAGDVDRETQKGTFARGIRFQDLGRCMTADGVSLVERTHTCSRYSPGLRPRELAQPVGTPAYPETMRVQHWKDVPTLEPYPGDENAPSLVGFPPEVQAIEDAYHAGQIVEQRGQVDVSAAFRPGVPRRPLEPEITRESIKIPSEPPKPRSTP